MAKTVFQIQQNLGIYGKGALLEVEKILGNAGFAQGLTKAIGLYQLIDQEYKKAIGNDGKIVGSERTDILARIDLFFNGLIYIWKQLEQSNAVSIKIENVKADFLFMIEERNGLWEANGRLAVFFTRPVKNFQDIYNQKLAPEIVSLLKRYAEAVEDGIIDDEERADLKENLKRVLYYTLFLRLQIEQCFIND